MAAAHDDTTTANQSGHGLVAMALPGLPLMYHIDEDTIERCNEHFGAYVDVDAASAGYRHTVGMRGSNVPDSDKALRFRVLQDMLDKLNAMRARVGMPTLSSLQDLDVQDCESFSSAMNKQQIKRALFMATAITVSVTAFMLSSGVRSKQDLQRYLRDVGGVPEGLQETLQALELAKGSRTSRSRAYVDGLMLDIDPYTYELYQGERELGAREGDIPQDEQGRLRDDVSMLSDGDADLDMMSDASADALDLDEERQACSAYTRDPHDEDDDLLSIEERDDALPLDQLAAITHCTRELVSVFDELQGRPNALTEPLPEGMTAAAIIRKLRRAFHASPTEVSSFLNDFEAEHQGAWWIQDVVGPVRRLLPRRSAAASACVVPTPNARYSGTPHVHHLTH